MSRPGWTAGRRWRVTSSGCWKSSAVRPGNVRNCLRRVASAMVGRVSHGPAGKKRRFRPTLRGGGHSLDMRMHVRADHGGCWPRPWVRDCVAPRPAIPPRRRMSPGDVVAGHRLPAGGSAGAEGLAGTVASNLVRSALAGGACLEALTGEETADREAGPGCSPSSWWSGCRRSGCWRICCWRWPSHSAKWCCFATSKGCLGADRTPAEGPGGHIAGG